jgi:hypothetical protein
MILVVVSPLAALLVFGVAMEWARSRSSTRALAQSDTTFLREQEEEEWSGLYVSATGAQTEILGRIATNPSA